MTTATVLPDPRPYWNGTSDDQLIAARDEYRGLFPDDPFLAAVADEIDDDLARRANFRDRLIRQHRRASAADQATHH